MAKRAMEGIGSSRYHYPSKNSDRIQKGAREDVSHEQIDIQK